MPQLVRRENLSDLLARLMFVYALRVKPQPYDFLVAKNQAASFYRHLRGMFAPRDPNKPERIPVADEDVFRSAALHLKHRLKHGAVLERMFDKTVKRDPITRQTRDGYLRWVRKYDGAMVEFDANTDMNALFGELYWSFREEWLENRQRSGFQRTAGLARSATLEYHRRQLN